MVLNLFAGATAIHNSFFGKHATTLHMTNFGCSGSERRLMDCSHSTYAVTSCGDGQYAGVRCLGKKINSSMY